jgi:SAM-dependent methyltransferase
MYSKFAHEFSKTRTRPWPCVAHFLATRAAAGGAATLLDAGCGNGRNLHAAAEAGYAATGFDICPEFVDICRARGLDVTLGSIESSAGSRRYDAVLCIAVLHHLRTPEARLHALHNLFEALNPGGALLMTVWSYEAEGARFPKHFAVGDNSVPWNSQKTGSEERYYYIYDRPRLDELLDGFRRASAPAAAAHIEVEWEEQNWIVHIRRQGWAKPSPVTPVLEIKRL